MSQLDDIPRILACRGDDELLVERAADGALSILSDVEIYGRGAPTTLLKAGASEETNAHRLELIQSLRDGKHLELVIKRALTYRQKKGGRNRRGLRFALDSLAPGAPTFRSQPFLVDHNTHEQSARKGTLLTSELSEDSKGVPALYMGFSVVKPDAAISVLDGTIDRFSIGWFPTGPVLCSVHGCDVRSKDSCYCWPLEEVEVDGKTQIVEYEYQAFEGKELSAVNVPAVKGTKIEEYRAALSAELKLPPRARHKENAMALSRLAAALGLTALAEPDEDRAVTIVGGMQTRALAAEQERDTARAQVATLTAERDAAVAAGEVVSVNALIAGAYRDGKLKWGRDSAGAPVASPREVRLRGIAKRDGLDALTAEVAELEVVVPIGQRALAGTTDPERVASGALDDAQLAKTAAQLGITVEDMRKRMSRNGAGQ